LGNRDHFFLTIHFCFSRSMHRGVSGNKVQGCNAIIVSGSANNECLDEFRQLVYGVDRETGAMALLKSAHQNNPVRVFRSSLRGQFRAPIENKTEKKAAIKRYRYDGLYKTKIVRWAT